jgi:hypothetical protein
MNSRQLPSDKLKENLPALLDVIGDGVALVDALFDNGVISREMRAAHLVSSIRGNHSLLDVCTHWSNAGVVD